MLQSKNLDDIPFDVYDYIFDIVRVDEGRKAAARTLSAASQTCKAWADMTRRARFYTLVLSVRTPDSQHTTDFSLQNLVQEPFFGKVQRGRCVRALTLRWGCERGKSEIDINDIYPQFLPLFPGLRELELRGVLCGSLEKPVVQRFNLQKLTLSAGKASTFASKKLNNPRALQDILQLFSSLNDLQLKDILNWEVEARPTSTLEQGAIQQLEVASNATQEVSQTSQELCNIRSILLRNSFAPNALIRNLCSAHVRGLDIMTLRNTGTAVLDACAATLERLTCCLPNGRTTDDSTRWPTFLARLPALRSLTLVVPFQDLELLGPTCREPWTALTAIFKGLADHHEARSSMPALERIELQLQYCVVPMMPMGVLSPDVEEDARKAFIENMPLLEDANAALECLFQSRFAPSLHITCWIHSCRVFPYPVRPHSCLNQYIARAFPTLSDGGAITFSDGACDCEGKVVT